MMLIYGVECSWLFNSFRCLITTPIAAAMGTDNNTPENPSQVPPANNENNIQAGLTLILLPIKYGVKIELSAR